MILEVAQLNILPGKSQEFQRAFEQAQKIIASSPGYISHELLRSIEVQDQFILLVRWQTLADHEEGFRRSAPYLEWKKLLHHFYDPFPRVDHYEPFK